MQTSQQDTLNTPLSSKDHYTSIAIVLHWSVSICFLSALALGIAKGYIPKEYKSGLMFWHKSFGLSVLFFMVLRVIWRLSHRPPAYPGSMPEWMRKVANANHLALYIVALLMPVSGLLMSSAHGYASSFWGLFSIQLPVKSKALSSLMNSTHYYTAWIVGGLLVLHIGAVLKHQFIDKDDILGRMTKFK